MPLTPSDVQRKRFSPTKFREGYDQSEVDEFLREVAVELERLRVMLGARADAPDASSGPVFH